MTEQVIYRKVIEPWQHTDSDGGVSGQVELVENESGFFCFYRNKDNFRALIFWLSSYQREDAIERAVYFAMEPKKDVLKTVAEKAKVFGWH